MELSVLLSDLKAIISDGKLFPEQIYEWLYDNITFPDDFYNIDLDVEEMNFSDEDPLPHLLISGYSRKSLDEVQPVLDNCFRKAESLRLKKCVADVKYGLFWTPEAFQGERNITGLYFDDVTVDSRLYTVDPTKSRLGIYGDSHKIDMHANQNKMSLTATGKYLSQLEDLGKSFGFQFAKLNIAPEDAEKLLEAYKSDNNLIKYFRTDFEKKLQPKQMSTMSISLGLDMSFGTKEVIELVVPVKYLWKYVEVLEKSLYGAQLEDETHVVELTKNYGFFDILKSNILSDLKTFAVEVPAIDLDILYDKPMLIDEQAKILLDNEIKIISDYYNFPSFLILDNNDLWKNHVKRLAREHFGDNTLKDFDNFSAEQYLNFLEDEGYKYPESLRDDSDNMNNISKERHLFEFFKQSYAEDARESIQKLKEYYKNSRPQMYISAKSRDNDASKIKKIKLPRKARLFSFDISEHMSRATPYSNNFSISRILVGSSDIHFSSRVSLDSPDLLQLQDYACKEIGIAFKS
ncbi:MAG: hypothetical protein KAS90_00250 [Candidatus Aenigmarchaeota archaeon]|nr:hypothetical protein [Candidatus Aenigmarchaeota archaeon]